MCRGNLNVKTIKSPIDAVKFSNTLQISPNFNYEKKILNTHCDGQQFNEYQQEGSKRIFETISQIV
jgi:hypothetical protein